MISTEIDEMDKSGDFGKALDGYAMRIYALESSIIESIYSSMVNKGMASDYALAYAKEHVESLSKKGVDL